VIHRGEIWWAALAEPTGSEPGYRRPVVIVQSDEFNQSRIQTVVVVAVTTNLRLAAAPGNVFCRRRDTGLPKNSVINVSQVSTINKIRLTQRVGRLPGRLIQMMEAGLRLVLGL